MVKRQAGVPGFNTYMYMYLHMQCHIARLFLLVVHGGLFMSSLAGRTLSMIPPQGRDYFYSFNPSMYYSIAISVMEKFHVDIHPRKKEVRF